MGQVVGPAAGVGREQASLVGRLVAGLAVALHQQQLYCLLAAALSARWEVELHDDACVARVWPVQVAGYAALVKHRLEVERLLAAEVGGRCELSIGGPPHPWSTVSAPRSSLGDLAAKRVAEGSCRCRDCEAEAWVEEPLPRLYVVTGHRRPGTPGCMDADLAPLDEWARRRTVRMAPFCDAGDEIARHLDGVGRRTPAGFVLIARGGDLLAAELAQVRATILPSVRRLVEAGWVVADAVGHTNHSLALPWSLPTPSVAAQQLVEVRRLLMERRQLLERAGGELGSCALTSRSAPTDTFAVVTHAEAVAQQVREVEASLPDPVLRFVRGQPQVWARDGLGRGVVDAA